MQNNQNNNLEMKRQKKNEEINVGNTNHQRLWRAGEEQNTSAADESHKV